MRVRHPRALEGDAPDIAVDVDGEHVPLDEDGTFTVPEDARGWLSRWCDANDVDPDDVVVDDTATCEAVKSDGDVCGRDLPCPYHSDDEED